jgi:AcrR family transcriptional regulator
LQKKKEAAGARASHAAGGKRRSRKDIVDRIVQAASDEFKRSGFTGATTAVIARKAGVTETQIFRYFGSKSNLFRETIFKPLDQHLLNFIIRHAAKGHRRARLGKEHDLYTTELQRFITEHADLVASLVVSQRYDTRNAHGVGEINSLSTYFEHSVAQMAKVMTNKSKADLNITARVTFAAVLGCVLFRNWVFPPGLASDKEITAAVNDFVLEGINAD